MLSIREFLEKQYLPKKGALNFKFDINVSIELSLKYLLFCAQAKKKITYKSLAESSNVPEPYIQAWSILGMTMGKILDAIYAYCEANKLPEITNLCVLASTGLPSIFDGEPTSKDIHKSRKAVNDVYKEIDKYQNWKKVVDANKFSDMDKISSTSFIERDNFAPSFEDVLKKGTREDIADKVAAVEAGLKVPSRIAAVLLFIFPIIFVVLEGKAELDFAWLFWPPLCLALWCFDIILKLCLPRVDKALDK